MSNLIMKEGYKLDIDKQLTVQHSPKTDHYFRAKLLKCFFGISLEPTFLCVIFTSVMYQLVAQNLYLEKACRVNIGYNTSVCDALSVRNSSGYTKFQEVSVQKVVTQMLGLRTVIQSFFPVCLVLFLGSWSDRHRRRKPLIVFPIIGEILCCVALIFNVIFFHELPLIFTVLGDSLPLALLGGWPSLFIGSYSYVGERCKNNNRTIKMGTLASARMIGHSLGSSLGGMLFSSFGFLSSILFCIISLSIALASSILLVKEEQTEKEYNTANGFFEDFLNITHFQKCLKTCFKKEPKNLRRRTKVTVFVLLIFIISGPSQAENTVNYMFTRYSFGWNTVQYGFFTATKFSMEVMGTILGLIVATKVFHFDEAVIGMFGVTSSIVANTIYASASSSSYFYSGITCDLFTILPYVALRSLITKTIPSNELGQSNSVVGICDAMVPLVFGPLYTTIYRYTIDFFPGTYFVFSILLKSIGLCMFIFLYNLSKGESRAEEKQLRDEFRLKSGEVDSI